MEPGTAPSGKWSDLRTRILSAIVMVAVGAVEIWLGGLAFAVLVVALTGVMIWELATMTAPLERRSALVVAGVAGVALVAALVLKTEVAVLFLTVPSVALLLTPELEVCAWSPLALLLPPEAEESAPLELFFGMGAMVTGTFSTWERRCSSPE